MGANRIAKRKARKPAQMLKKAQRMRAQGKKVLTLEEAERWEEMKEPGQVMDPTIEII